MKSFLFIIFLCVTNLLFSQKDLSKKSINNIKNPQKFIVIENEKYLLSNEAMSKMEFGWILGVHTPTEDGLKNGEPIILYGNNHYKENLYAVIGLKEDNNIYTTLSSYATFKYNNGSTLEESVEKYFKENYKVPEKKRRKKYKGAVYLYAIVEKDGSLTNIEVNKGINPVIDSSVIKMVRKMPAWIPAKKNDEVVRSKCLFGVYFKWFNQ